MLLAVTTSLLAFGCSSDPTPGTSTSEDLVRTVRTINGGVVQGDVPPGMVLVPGGRVTLGLTEKKMLEIGERENYQHLKWMISMYPAHNPLDAVDDLLVDVYEVTNLQYKRYLEAEGLEPSQELIDYRWSSFDAGTKVMGLPPGRENLPVSALSFYEAQNCARWLGKRLPTEQEWETIARRKQDSDVFYLWGEGWESWDREKCNNVYNSSKNGQRMLPTEGGSYPEDVSADGVFDLCGGVYEWTNSPFTSYPGFKPIGVKRRGQRKKVDEVGPFNSEFRVFRGGSFTGNEYTNSVVYRNGEHPNSYAEAIGFRCVTSATPALDRMRRAALKELALMRGDIKDRLTFAPNTMAAQSRVITDADQLTVQSDALGYVHIDRTESSNEAKLLKNSVEEPVFISVLTTTQPIAEPRLPAGTYALYLRGEGESDAQEEAKKAARKAGSKKKDDKKKEEEEAEEAEEDPEAAAAMKALQDAGFEAKPRDLLDVPTDQTFVLFRDAAGDYVAWLPVDLEKTTEHPATLSYQPSAGKVSGGDIKTAGRVDEEAESNDLAEIRFSLHIGAGSKQYEIVLPLEFPPASFEAMEAPVMADDSKSKRRGRR